MKIVICVVVLLVFGFAFYAVTTKDEVVFRCPESYSNTTEREKALEKFLVDYSEKNPDATLEDFVAYRYDLLVKNHCDQTLENLRRLR